MYKVNINTDESRILFANKIMILSRNGVFMKYNRGNIVNYRSKKAKIIGVSEKSGNIKYKLRLYDKFNTIVYNINPREISI